MPDIPPPTPPSPVDGIRADDALSPPVSGMRRKLMIVGGTVYGLYALWCLGLMLLLPDPSGSTAMIPLALGSLAAGGVVLLGLGLFFLQRIARWDSSQRARRIGLLRVVLLLAPGIFLTAVVPFLILREPPLRLDIVDPTSREDLIAPVTVTFSVERAVGVLAKLGMHPALFTWDTNGDGNPDDQGLLPQTTTTLTRPGNYVVAVRVDLDNGESRRIARVVSIPHAVFELRPSPVVEKPSQFSVAHLLADPKLLSEVRWDFDSNGTVDETSKTPEILHTFYVEGKQTVTAIVVLQNGTETTYRREINVQEPAPLPFPVTLATEPRNLIGPVPFGVLFSLDTQAAIGQIEWSFGDGKNESGKDLRRIGHVFELPGVYPVVTRVRNQSGMIAEITSLVRATDVLTLGDLRFEGTPDVRGTSLEGEVPLTVRLTPKTSTPLIQFTWEAPEGFAVQPGGSTVQGVFRRQGSYTLTLVAQDPDGKATRIPLSVEVQPPAAEPTIELSPEGGTAPLTVTFDASNSFVPPGDRVAGFEWTFGDEANQAKPELGTARLTHTYTTPGEYKVGLRVVMASGKEFTAQRVIVVRRQSISACITTSRVQVQAGKGVQFDSSCSTGALPSVLWDVRSDADPQTVIAQSPEPQYVHVFDSPGVYTVMLTVRDQAGNQDAASVSITVTP